MVTHFSEKITDLVLNRDTPMTYIDVYKILYQAFHGAGHAVENEDKAREWFWKEWDEVKIQKNESAGDLYQVLTIPDVTPELYRIHMRQFFIMKLEPEKLIGEFLRTAEEFPTHYPSDAELLHDRFIDAWEIIARVEFSSSFKETKQEYRKLSDECKNKGWPAVRHSQIYRDMFRPHYRVVMDLSRVM